MLIHLIAVGTRMPGWVNEGVAEYQKRLAGDIRLQIHEIPLPKRGKKPLGALIEEEARAIEKKLDKLPGCLHVALEVTGKTLSTDMLATTLGQFRDQGQDLCILTGGPDGLLPALSQRCHQRWSLSALTLPHPLVRIMLAEQIYRGWSILAGHPYHR